MKKIHVFVLLMAALMALSACGGGSAPTTSPTPAPTLTPDPIFGPTPSPTRPPAVEMQELVLADTLRIAPPYPVSHLYDHLPFGVEDAEYTVDVYYCSDDYPWAFSYIFAVIDAEGNDFDDPERVRKAYEELCAQFMGDVLDAVREEQAYSGPDGNINGLKILTKVSSVPVDIRVVPYGGKLFMAYGMAINGDIEDASAVLDGFTFVDSVG